MWRLAILLFLIPTLAAAESSTGTFDIYVRGLKAGVLAFSGDEGAGRYAASATLSSAGIVGAFRQVRFAAEVRGAATAAGYRPERFAETFVRGDRNRRSVIAYRGGMPQARVSDPPDDPEPYELEASTQGGTIDPMTAIWGILRDVPQGRACRFQAVMFDGARRSRIGLGAPRRSGDSITCAGEYRRLAGFAPDDMADKTRFPFRLTYRRDGALWQVDRIETDTIFGTAALIRR